MPLSVDPEYFVSADFPSFFLFVNEHLHTVNITTSETDTFFAFFCVREDNSAHDSITKAWLSCADWLPPSYTIDHIHDHSCGDFWACRDGRGNRKCDRNIRRVV